MKFIDWFAGIGGVRRGMELAGHECVGFCEHDKYAVASYTSMHLITEEQRKYLATLDLRQRQKEILKEEYRNGEWYADDIRTVDAGCIPQADIWCFGFPCVDISLAGRQDGLQGNHSGLFYRVMQLIGQLPEEKRPTYLLAENVKNLLSIHGGWDFARLLIEMDKYGYDAEWQLLDSKDFGVPQHRERVFVVGHLRGRSTRQIFYITTSIAENYKFDRHQDLCANTIERVDRLARGIYPIDRQTDRQTEYSDHQGKRIPQILQVGNIMPTRNRRNPNQGRVYSIRGIAPCLTNLSGGGGRVPWIIY